jgi:hypothetical protein
MKKNLIFGTMLCLGLFLLPGCAQEDDSEDDDENIPTASQVFKFKIDGQEFKATSITTTGTSGMIIAKGLKASNGPTVMEGSTRLTLSFGADQSGNLATGLHDVFVYFPTQNAPDNRSKCIFADIVINNKQGYVLPGEGSVTVDNYYTSSYWQGAKGTFNNIKVLQVNTNFEMDTVLLTDGEFNYKFVY